MKINKINQATCRLIKDRIHAELSELEEELGIKITSKAGSFSDTDFSFKMSVVIPDTDGIIRTEEERIFPLLAPQFGLSKDDLGSKFKWHNGEIYEIKGIAPRSTKYPIKAKRVKDGKGFKFPASIASLIIKEQVTS